MPATDAGETSGTHNLRPRPTSPDNTMYILMSGFHFVLILHLQEKEVNVNLENNATLHQEYFVETVNNNNYGAKDFSKLFFTLVLNHSQCVIQG